jgi:acetamidase/formamidase
VKRIRREDALGYRLDASLPPALRVEQREAFAVETEDASSGHLTAGDKPPTLENAPYIRYSPAMANPVGGPVLVEGVPPGRVRIEILEVSLAPTGVAYNRRALSPLGDVASWPDAREEFTQLVEHRDGEAIVSGRLRWPAAPMIGTLACAPEWEVRASAVGQGPWGGNLDVLDFRPGATVFLNAYHEGALLFVGDVHGCQGDGEYFGVADESRAEVVLSVSAAGGQLLPAPRVETSDRIVALGIDKPLEAAAHAAIRHLMDWLVEDFGYTGREAYLTVGLNPDFRLRVYQMTAIRDLSFVVGATLPRAYLS